MSVPGTYSSMFMSSSSAIEFVGAGTLSAGTTTTGLIPDFNASTQNGDLVFVQVTASSFSGGTPTSVTTPSGWTQLTATDGDTTTFSGRRFYVFYRLYDGTSPTLVPAVNAKMTAITTSWRNVNISTPFDVASRSNSGSGNRDFVARGLTTVSSSCFIIILASCSANTSAGGRFGDITNTSLTEPSTFFDYSSSTAAQSQMAYGGFKTAAGAVTNTTSLIVTSTSDDWGCFTIPLRPA